MLRKVIVDKSLRCVIVFPDSTFPFVGATYIYNHWHNRTINCHWHPEFVFGYVLSGPIDYYINDTHIRLQTGDFVFANSNMLHTSRSPKPRSDAAMFVFNFAASLFSENLGGLLYKKYFHPILSSSIEGFTIPAENPLGQEIRDLTMEIYALAPSAFGYELEGLKCASQVWMAVLRYMEENKDALLYRVGGTLRTERMKEILSYIHRNYKEKIIVDDIAKHVNISRSECFRCFKRFMNKRPNEYINEYRLSKAAVLLKDTEKSITDICTECGFVSASYFTKVFKELYAMTPLQFRTMK